MVEQTAEAWDREAPTFDQAPDHGLSDARVRETWRELLRRVLPPPPARVADLGCGTGSLALLTAELGHRVDGVDFSEAMLDVAASKVSEGADVHFHPGDAGRPPLPAGAFDAVVTRHVLWALPDPVAALRAWRGLLAPGGRVVLVEGRWATGAGLTDQDAARLLLHAGYHRVVEEPLVDPGYWGGAVGDERYVLVARPNENPPAGA
jgi:ubiquinone/menaquinone biosynthesis C-methylase UbiE